MYPKTLKANPKPQTLEANPNAYRHANPKAYTLNPTKQTPNPKPSKQTLNAKPKP